MGLYETINEVNNMNTNQSEKDENNNNDNNDNDTNNDPSMPTNYALPQGIVRPFESICLDALISKRQVQGTTKNASGSPGETSTNMSRPVPCVEKAGLQYAVLLTVPRLLHHCTCF